jgi:hypothetical protein
MMMHESYPGHVSPWLSAANTLCRMVDDASSLADERARVAALEAEIEAWRGRLRVMTESLAEAWAKDETGIPQPCAGSRESCVCCLLGDGGPCQHTAARLLKEGKV